MNPGGAASEIFEKIRVRLVQFASFKGMREHADDVAQETLVVLWTKFRSTTNEGDLVPLAYGVCRKKIQEARRGRVRLGNQLDPEIPLPDHAADAQQRLEEAERQQRLKEALAAMSERDQALFRMRLERRSTAEIAKAFGVPEGTIYVWEHRYKKALFEKLG